MLFVSAFLRLVVGVQKVAGIPSFVTGKYRIARVQAMLITIELLLIHQGIV